MDARLSLDDRSMRRARRVWRGAIVSCIREKPRHLDSLDFSQIYHDLTSASTSFRFFGSKRELRRCLKKLIDKGDITKIDLADRVVYELPLASSDKDRD